MARGKAPVKRKSKPARRLSVGAFEKGAARELRRLKEERRPIVLTEHGKPAAVVITPDEFERLRQHDRFLDAVREGLADSDAGRVIDDAELERELAAELGRP